MPQSWPSQWILLFFLFILSFMLILILINFSFQTFSAQSTNFSKNLTKHLAWLW